MIRERIFRLHRLKSPASSAGTDASGQKFDFTFSNIQAIQVPKRWDKVSLSLISSESGKTVRKAGKLPVKNGTCQWTETFSESIWISDVDSSKELEEHLFKFLVATGSSKSGILGEAAINLAAFLSSESPALVSLPLKKCNYGTILQVEVKCLTPKTNLRDEKWREMNANKQENADHDNIENQSEISDCTTAKSMESPSSNNVGNSSRPTELSSRETSFSASVSRYSFDSMDDSVGRQSFSSQSERNGGNNVIVRQDSIESNDSASYCSHSTHSSVKSVRSLPFARNNQVKNQREEFRKVSNTTSSSSQQNGCSSKTFKEADDAVVQELEAEARMWEQNARKMAVDMEKLRKELSDQNLTVTNFNMELDRSHLECHKLTQEIEHLKLLLEESSMKQNVGQNSELQEIARSNIQRELENENLSLQLKKTQESNAELISVLQEMEETIDKQKLEIENLSGDRAEFIYTEAKNAFRDEQDCNEAHVNDQVSVNKLKSLHDCDLDNTVSETSVADIREQIPSENNSTVELELLNAQEPQRTLQGNILVLESTLQDKIIEVEIEQNLKNQVLKEFVVECKHRLTVKEQKIMSLEAALSGALYDENLKESEQISHVDVSKEIRQLKEKIQELETDCNELTEENLELLFELKELKKNVSKDSNVCHHDSTSEVSQLEFRMQQPSEEREKTEILRQEIADHEAESENLELLSQSSTVEDCNRNLGHPKCHEKAEEQESEIIELQKQSQGSNNDSTPENVFELGTIRDVDELLPALLEQLQDFLVSIKKKESEILLPRVKGSKDASLKMDVSECINLSSQMARLKEVLDQIVMPLDSLLTKYENSAQNIEENTRRDGREDQNRRVCVSLEEDASCSHIQGGKNSDNESNFDVQSQNKEHKSVVFEPVADSLKKEKGIDQDLSYHKIQDSENKIDELRLMEPENNQNELVKHLSDLQEENIYLTQRVSGLEAQLRYLTDKSESRRLELQHSESKAEILESQIRGLEEEIELQKLDMKQKLLEMQKQWSEAQEECTALSKVNIRLQATTENLVEEYNSMQKFNGELREQKLKLQNHCMILEAEARRYRYFDSCCKCAEKMETLEVKYSLLKEEITARGVSLGLKLDAFDIQKKEDDNKLLLQKHLMKQIQTEKVEEAANLESSDRENKVVLAANQEKLLIMFENIMNGESKTKSIINELESKVKLSELERLQLSEDNSLLHMQLQKVPELQNEVLALRVSLREMKSQNQLLEASYKSLSKDYQELKCKEVSMVEKISSMKKTVSEAEGCRHKKNALEEKILRLEGDLIARDALCVQDAEMKNELNQIKIANSQLLMKVKNLEDVREDLQSRLQCLEQELKQRSHAGEIHSKSTSEFCHPHFRLLDGSTTQQSNHSKVFNRQESHSGRSQVPVMDYESRIHLLENELAKALKANDIYKSQLESAPAVASKNSESKETIKTAKAEHKISLLEAELQEIRERYLQISLKYAEVEAQREQLVMKLKGLNI